MTPEEAESGGQESVSPSAYDSRYYFSSCEGYRDFLSSSGRKLGPRLQKALQLARIMPGERVLDVGCGRGELVIHAALLGAEAVGIDYAEEAVRLAQKAISSYPDAVQKKASVLLMNARKLEFEDKAFDVLLLSDIVEHLYPEELAETLSEAARVLRPGGRMVLHTCPNRILYDITYPVYVRHVHRLVCRVAELAGYQSYVIGPMLSVGPEFPRTEEERLVHVNEQTAPELSRSLAAAGFKVTRTEYWEIPNQWPYLSRRIMIELMLLDAVRYLRPFSYVWPLNRVFTNHIWMVARRRG
jgi:2-polyprenyl-3-methyl-5-hydroxy-6-metoxy-1,4-benzoquinol methylase